MDFDASDWYGLIAETVIDIEKEEMIFDIENEYCKHVEQEPTEHNRAA